MKKKPTQAPTHSWLVKQEGRYLTELHISTITLGSVWDYSQKKAAPFHTAKAAHGIADLLAGESTVVRVARR